MSDDVNAPENREFMESAVKSWEGRQQIVYGEELKFDEKEHAYTWGGRLVPGVTSILQVIGKPALVPWAAKLTADYWLKALAAGRIDFTEVHKESKSAHRREAQVAADIGHNVHEYAECWFKGLPPPELKSDQAKRGVEAFHKWLDSHKIEVVASERRVFSKSHFYAGTMDFAAKIDGIAVVGDIKTSSGIYPEMFLQTAAYQHAIQEEKGIEIGYRLIVRFDKKTGSFEVKSLLNFDRDFSGFLSALSLHRSLKSIEAEDA